MLSPTFLIFMGLFSMIGIVCNLACSIKIWKTFNLNLAPYLIIFIGSTYTCITSFGTVIAVGHLLIYKIQNAFWCSFYASQNPSAALLGSCILCLLSVLR